MTNFFTTPTHEIFRDTTPALTEEQTQTPQPCWKPQLDFNVKTFNYFDGKLTRDLKENNILSNRG